MFTNLDIERGPHIVYIYKVWPPSYKMVSLTIVIGTINHSYWSYKPTWLSRGPHFVYTYIYIQFFFQILQYLKHPNFQYLKVGETRHNSPSQIKHINPYESGNKTYLQVRHHFRYWNKRKLNVFKSTHKATFKSRLRLDQSFWKMMDFVRVFNHPSWGTWKNRFQSDFPQIFRFRQSPSRFSDLGMGQNPGT